MNGTQVNDISKKVDYPNIKRGRKIVLTKEANEDITNSFSDTIDGGNVNHQLASKIAFNMKAESEAIEFYNELLTYDLTDEDRKQIEEFISDEKNHLQGLSEMVTHYDGDIPTAKD